MIHLSIELDDVDFDRLIEQYLPVIGDQLRASGNPVGMLLSNGMSVGMAKGILRTLSQDNKEQLAADLINGGQVKLRHLPTLRTDAQVEPGDVISVRGFGRLQIQEIGSPTRKGRYPLQMLLFGDKRKP